MKVAILGYGTVGSGVYEVLEMNRETIKKTVGEELEVKYVLDLRDFPGQPVEKVLVHDFSVIVNDPEVAVVAEVMGGVEPAYSFVKEALLKGKAVCTSNKELVSRHGAEFIEIARQKKTNFFFEASVGGGIPVIRPLITSLAADEIVEMKSIVNGTTNYMLTKMADNGMEFDAVLKEAQSLGYAERNPAADIEGLDAARKTSILASLVSHRQVNCEDIYTEGITSVTAADITYMKKLGKKIKLISRIIRDGEQVRAMVAPFVIDDSCRLFHVDGVFNALLVRGNAVGETMFFGSGAGKLPTASAVVNDMTEAAKHIDDNIAINWKDRRLEPESMDTFSCRFFIRVSSENETAAKEAFGAEEVFNVIDGETGMITAAMSETEFKEKAAQTAVISHFRMD